MAYSKIILNGETLMDVTSDTVVAGSMTSGTTATKKDGTKITGTIVTKSAADLTASGSTVTVPGGYYSAQATKNVASVTHPNPTAAITSSTGVVTATHTQSAGYVAAGTTTGTTQLTTQAAQTINTSTADQTVASYRWLTGTQTIKSVTTSNLTAANIASGVVVKVGDANNASRITQVTGTYAPAVSSATVTPTETAQTLNATGVYGYKPVTINAISSTYVGTGVAKKSSADTTFASATGTFTAPIGYYSAAATKTVTTQAAQTIYPSTADQTIASYRWLTGTQTIKSVLTTNLRASYIASGITVYVGDASNAARIAEVTGTFAGGYTADEIATRTISGILSGSTSSKIYANAFFSCTRVTEANFPSVASIGDKAFYYCTNLSIANFPEASIIGENVFTYCFKLATVNCPKVVYIQSYAFQYCQSIANISFPLAQTIQSNAFFGCSAITTASFPNVTILSISAFAYCRSLITANFPMVSEIAECAFYGCSSLSIISFPIATTIGTYTFGWCRALSIASFPSLNYIGENAFSNCTLLISLYLMGSQVVSLFNSSVFTSTPIGGYSTSAGRYGSIFVPSSLYNSYIIAAGWSNLSNRIVSM